MKVVIESQNRRVKFDITADQGKLKVAITSGSQQGHTVVNWGEAKSIVLRAMDRLRTDEALQGE